MKCENGPTCLSGKLSFRKSGNHDRPAQLNECTDCNRFFNPPIMSETCGGYEEYDDSFRRNVFQVRTTAETR